jgi:hypothetical protein
MRDVTPICPRLGNGSFEKRAFGFKLWVMGL